MYAAVEATWLGVGAGVAPAAAACVGGAQRREAPTRGAEGTGSIEARATGAPPGYLHHWTAD